MKVVVDANILFTCLIANSTTARILVHDTIKLCAPEFMLKEFAKYETYICKKTKQSKNDFNEHLGMLKRRIEIVQKAYFSEFVGEAKKISPDPKDVAYLALAMKEQVVIWNNDKKLQTGQDVVSVYTTAELIKIL